MKRLYIFLAIVGVLFFIQAGIIATVFPARSAPENLDPQKFALYISELSTRQFVCSYTGSLVGCFGSFLLLVYLKIRAIEKRVVELQGHKEKDGNPTLSGR